MTFPSTLGKLQVCDTNQKVDPATNRGASQVTATNLYGDRI